MKILFVDKQEILLDGIANLLAKSAHELVENANTISDALKYFSEAEFDILIADFKLVDDNGLALIRKVKKIYPKLKIIVLSMRDEAHLVEEILKSGSERYVLEKNSQQNLIATLDSIEKGKITINTEINKILLEPTDQKKKDKLLSSREKEVLKLISDEYSIKEIAEKLAITEKKVESHKKNIIKKTKTSSEIGLLKYAYANNLL